MRLSSEVIEQYHEAPSPEKYAVSVKRAERLIKILWRLQVYGSENVPQNGATIVAMQHRAYRDPWILGAAAPRALRGMGKEELLRWYYFGLGSVYLTNRGQFFANRKGKASKGDMEPFYEALRNEEAIAIALEGTSRFKGREIGESKMGVGRFAAKIISEGIPVTIVPVAIASDVYKPRSIIPVVFGEGFQPSLNLEVATVHQRRTAASEIDMGVRERLQELSNIAYDVREGNIKPNMVNSLRTQHEEV